MLKSKKRILALILAALLLLMTVAGCKGKEPAVDTPSDTPSQSEEPTSSETPESTAPAETVSYQYDDVYAMYAPDTAMITVDEYVVTWEELFYYLCTKVSQIEGSLGEIADWSESFDGGMTYAELVKTYSEEDAKSGKILEYGAKKLGAKLSDEDIEAIRANYESVVESYGGEEAFLDLLKQNYCYSTELFEYLNTTQLLLDLCLSTLYGEGAGKISDGDVAEYMAGNEFLMAKHILRMTRNDDNTEKTDEEKAAILAETEEIVAKLDAYKGDDFGTYFDELMMEFSEDPGSLASPEGYLFQNGDMVPEFYEGCLALDIGGYSEPIETSYGYHIIYRIPVNYDSIPVAFSAQGNYNSLRQEVAIRLFDVIATEWQDSAEVTYSKEYEALDIAKLFG